MGRAFFVRVWLTIVAIGSQTNVPDPGAPVDRQSVLREFVWPPPAAGKVQEPKYQRTYENCLQLLLTRALYSGETTKQCLKLHPTIS